MRRAARAFMTASRHSLEAVVAEIDAAARRLAPELDVVLFFASTDGALVCARASGARAEYYYGSRLPLDDAAHPVSSAASLRHRVVARTGLMPAIPGDRAFLAVPLVDGLALLGVLYVASSTGSSLGVAESIVTLVDLAVPACRLASERELDRRRATIDGLTGLLTARAFRDRLADACGDPRRRAAADLALLFLDTDNFKACNDALGHSAGDTVLRILAMTLGEASGPDALVGRNGGDEFCVVIAAIAKTEAIRRAEHIRRSIERYPFADALGVPTLPKPITASIGVATFPADAETAETLLERADAAMYYSKRSGRNRVSFYTRGAELEDYPSSLAYR